MDWLEGWKYRISHELTNPIDKPIRDVPILIRVHYGSGWNYGENVYLNRKCKPDFSDIRITDSDGVTILAPKKGDWIYKEEGKYMEIGFKVPEIPPKPKTRKIYVYYGKIENNKDKTFGDE